MKLAEDHYFGMLKKNISETMGFNADQYEAKHFQRRIHSRMRTTNSECYKKYLERLKTDNKETENLKAALTINVTEFFRNPEVYDSFSNNVLPILLGRMKSDPKKPIRIWSLGCSTGEEPFSIAMTMAAALDERVKKTSVKIFASEIDERALKTAVNARYKDVSKIPPPIRERYVIKLPDNTYTFTKEILDMISFKKHNIFKDEPLRNIDVLFCRNTIIYFNTDSKRVVYNLFNNSLAEDGFLVLGMAESFISHRNYGFEIFERKRHIYRKQKNIQVGGC